MWAFDPNPLPEEELAEALFPQNMTLAGWLLRWTRGRLLQPWLTRDPATGDWRGFPSADESD